MAMYAKVGNGNVTAYPYLDRHLWEDNPNTSFPKNPLNNNQIRDSYGVAEVVGVEMPYKPGWRAIEKTPTLVDGAWTQTWGHAEKDAGDLSNEEITKVDAPIQDGFTAVEGIPEIVGDVWKQTWNLVENTWLKNRMIAYGPVANQIEFITENGLEAWQTKVAEIKERYPK